MRKIFCLSAMLLLIGVGCGQIADDTNEEEVIIDQNLDVITLKEVDPSTKLAFDIFVSYEVINQDILAYLDDVSKAIWGGAERLKEADFPLQNAIKKLNEVNDTLVSSVDFAELERGQEVLDFLTKNFTLKKEAADLFSQCITYWDEGKVAESSEALTEASNKKDESESVMKNAYDLMIEIKAGYNDPNGELAIPAYKVEDIDTYDDTIQPEITGEESEKINSRLNDFQDSLR